MISKLIYLFLRVAAGPAFSNPRFSAKVLLRHFLWQKILRRNAHVPWPVHPTTVVKYARNIERGTRNPGMAPWCYLDGRNGIRIGTNTWIGPRVSLISMNHDPVDYSHYLEAKPIKIGDNCWIAAGAIITAGVELGDHTVVAAGAVVTRSTPGNVLVGGVPAKILKQLPDYKSG